MVHQITNGIKVSVETHFEGTFYNKEIIQFAFSYVVKIKNERHNPVQLLSRTWHICDALNSKEKASMNVLLRGAAVRILVTRLYDKIFHPNEGLNELKDPEEYLKILKWHQENKDLDL